MCKHEFRSDYSKWYLFSTKYMSVFSPSVRCEIPIKTDTGLRKCDLSPLC